MAAQRADIIVIAGPTASGKSDLAVRIARKFNGEIISADSRQIYKYMDIGTGKVPGTWIAKHKDQKLKVFYYKKIPHYCIDFVHPKKRFTVSDFKSCAARAINTIRQKGKIPVLAGGTGFYIQTVIDSVTMPEVPPNWKLRKQLEQKSAGELFAILKKLDKRRAKAIDKNNKRRLIRAIEIIKTTGKKVPKPKKSPGKNALFLGIKKDNEELKKLISSRLKKRIRQGMIREVKNLHEKYGVSWNRLYELGLEYRYIALHLQGKISKEEVVKKLESEIWHYAKRQMTWFKKEKRIQWIRTYQEAESATRKFLKILKN